jgi:hypothetical protein
MAAALQFAGKMSVQAIIAASAGAWLGFSHPAPAIACQPLGDALIKAIGMLVADRLHHGCSPLPGWRRCAASPGDHGRRAAPGAQLGTRAMVASAPTMLPRAMEKLDQVGCRRAVVGLVKTSGFSFKNGSDGDLCAWVLFIAHATTAPGLASGAASSQWRRFSTSVSW